MTHFLRNFIAAAMLLCCCNYANADDFGFLTLETTDGQKASLAATGLTLTVMDNALIADDKRFPLENLYRMYFSSTDETTTGIHNPEAEIKSKGAELYDLQGKRVNSSSDAKGVYLMRTENQTFKIIVK